MKYVMEVLPPLRKRSRGGGASRVTICELNGNAFTATTSRYFNASPKAIHMHDPLSKVVPPPSFRSPSVPASLADT